MKKTTLLLALVCVSITVLSAQKNIRNFIFGHSLINHAFPINPIPSQETSIPHWFATLAKSAGNDYAVGGQFGFLPQHINLPPTAQWGFDKANGAWDSDNEPFSSADFNKILITPGNFVQWQSPNQKYPNDNTTPVDATQVIFEWCLEQESDLQFYIYENWPDMAEYLSSGFPPTASEWDNYNRYLNGDFQDWFIDYYELVSRNFPNTCISYIPTGSIISKLLQQAPYDQIPINQLYEDDAPHGRPTIYFLATLVTYMTMYEEKAPLNYEVDPIIHELIVDNYEDVINFIWEELNAFEESSDEVHVFCETPITSSTSSTESAQKIEISPNPSNNQIQIASKLEDHFIEIISMQGSKLFSSQIQKGKSLQIDVSSFQNGNYILIGKDRNGSIIYTDMFIKL